MTIFFLMILNSESHPLLTPFLIFSFVQMFDPHLYSFDRTEKKWEELQIEMGELPETRPQEGADNTTRGKHNSRAAC